MEQQQLVRIVYTNYKREIGNRHIKPINIWFGSTEYHPEEQWLLHAWDYDKQDFRDFAMKDIQEWQPETSLPVEFFPLFKGQYETYQVTTESEDSILEQDLPLPKKKFFGLDSSFLQ